PSAPNCSSTDIEPRTARTGRSGKTSRWPTGAGSFSADRLCQRLSPQVRRRNMMGDVTGTARALIVASLFVILLPRFSPSGAAAGDSRLAEAVMKRDAPAVRALLGQKVDANAPGKDGTPALHWAVRSDDLATARLLLGAGADPGLANRYGVTPLFLAASNGNAAMIRLLLEAGADANASDPTGETALMTAAGVGTLDAVQLLVDRGATIDAKDPM